MLPDHAMSAAAQNAGEEDPRRVRSRARLIDAATRLLGKGGIDAVTIDALTRTAGVSRATLYRHFGTGTELLAAAFERLIPPVPTVPADGTLRERLLTLVTKQAQSIEHAPLQLTMLTWLGLSATRAVAPESDTSGTVGETRPRLDHLRRRIIEQYRQPFDAILAADEAATHLRADFDPETALAQLGGPLIFNRLITGAPLDEGFCTRLVDDFLAANRLDHQGL